MRWGKGGETGSGKTWGKGKRLGKIIDLWKLSLNVVHDSLCKWNSKESPLLILLYVH